MFDYYHCNWIKCTSHTYSKNSDNNDDDSDDIQPYGHGDYSNGNSNSSYNNINDRGTDASLIIGLVCGAIAEFTKIAIGIYFQLQNKNKKQEIELDYY